MKRFCTTISLLAVFIIVNAQPTLTYDSHALLNGIDNPMTLCAYQTPGSAGQDITWDFSSIKEIKSFSGTIITASETGDLSSANTELTEFGSKFYFDVSEDGINQIGYKSSSGSTSIIYDAPVAKISYPFSYGNSYTSPFSGEYILNSNKVGDIAGTCSVEADASGTLTLPGNVTYNNTLRLKTVKTYTTSYTSGTEIDHEIVTYRWYNSTHRYPLLVITKITTDNGGTISTSTQAAYNNNAVLNTSNPLSLNFNEHVTVYPVPASNELNLKIYSNNKSVAEVAIFDLAGNKMVHLPAININKGINNISISDEVSLLEAGTYLLNIIKEGQKVTREISLIR